MTKNSQVIAIIPARYESHRFPGKPLAPLAGKTLIQQTYENAKKCALLDEVVVATDDQRIFDHVKAFGGEVVMTSSSCATGSDRLAEVVKKSHYADNASIILNIQGDEPSVSRDVLQSVVTILQNDPDAVMSTAAVKLSSAEEAAPPSLVKCVIDKRGNALYFSRAAIPYDKAHDQKNLPTYYGHLGIYAFRKEFLLLYGELAPTPLQKAENLEQLKVLEHGYQIKVAIVEEAIFGVDTPEDLEKAERLLCNQNTSSSQAESSPH